MNRIFVSYKTEDRARAGTIVQMLRDADLDVWWDQDIRPGQPWRQTIEENLQQADLCLVLWSAASVGREGQWVKEEAEHAKQAGKYLGVLIDRVAPPFGFSELQSIHAHEWDAPGLAAARDRLVHAIAAFGSHDAGPATRTTPHEQWQPEPARRTRKWPMVLFLIFIGIPGVIGILLAGSAVFLFLFPDKTYTIDQTVTDKAAPIPAIDVHAVRTGSDDFWLVTLKGVYPAKLPNSNSGDVFVCDLFRNGNQRMAVDIGRYPEEWESRNPVYTRKGEPFEINLTVKESSVKTMETLYVSFPAKEFDACAVHTPDLLPLLGKFTGQ